MRLKGRSVPSSNRAHGPKTSAGAAENSSPFALVQCSDFARAVETRPQTAASNATQDTNRGSLGFMGVRNAAC